MRSFVTPPVSLMMMSDVGVRPLRRVRRHAQRAAANGPSLRPGPTDRRLWSPWAQGCVVRRWVAATSCLVQSPGQVDEQQRSRTSAGLPPLQVAFARPASTPESGVSQRTASAACSTRQMSLDGQALAWVASTQPCRPHVGEHSHWTPMPRQPAAGLFGRRAVPQPATGDEPRSPPATQKILGATPTGSHQLREALPQPTRQVVTAPAPNETTNLPLRLRLAQQVPTRSAPKGFLSSPAAVVRRGQMTR